MNNRISLLKPHISNLELDFVKEAFQKNWITTSGENINCFEKEIQSLCDEKEVLCVNSGTSAIHLALLLLNVKKNDVVICQSFSFCASVNPVKYLGARPVFVDSEEETWNMSPYYLEKAITFCIEEGNKPKAIIVTNSYGMPAQWDKILALSKEYEIPVIEDAAEALGASYKKVMCGTLGTLGIYSFNGNKIVTTSSGGALILSSNKMKNRALHLATQAKVKSDGFVHDEIGYNYRMSNVLAGIGRGQLISLDKKVAMKRELNEFYFQLLKNERLRLQKEPNEDFISNYWLTNVLFDEEHLLFLLKQEFKNNNIEYRELWKPLHLQKPFINEPFFGEGLCESIHNKGLSLPSSTNMTLKEKERIVEVFKSLQLC